jgi:uncharacterized protein YndB with AHSA1/START domain
MSCPPDVVFDVLEDPHSYTSWVPGSQKVRAVDGRWPEPGARFHVDVGVGPVRCRRTTRIVAGDRPRRLSLTTHMPLLGNLDIGIEVRPNADGCVVAIDERWSGRRGAVDAADAALHFRNAETLRRLKSVCEEAPSSVTDLLRAAAPGSHWLDEAIYADIIAGTERCYLAVSEKHGPHVTPTAFSHAFGKLWIVVSAESLKRRATERRSSVGVLVRSGTRSMVVRGRAQILDPWKPWSLVQTAVDSAQALPALAAYTRRNFDRIASYLLESPAALFDLRPTHRVLMVVHPEALAVVDGAGVVARRGEWPEVYSTPVPDLPRSRGPSLHLDGVPPSVAALTEEDRAEAVVGWASRGGPLVLPAHWHARRNLASVPAQLVPSEEASARTCICIDSDGGPGLHDQQGLLVRGRGRMTQLGDYAAIALEADQTTFWRGTEMATVRAAGRR